MSATIPLLSTKGYQVLWDVSNSRHTAFYECPSSDVLKQLMVDRVSALGYTSDELWDGEITPLAELTPLNEADRQDDTTDALNAPIIRKALPEITSARAADHRLWASINCFALLSYTTKRWNQRTSGNAPCRTDEVRKLREWVQEHYLGHGSAMKRYNSAARLWWLTEMAQRAAHHSKHDADRLIPAMANDVEMYHQLLDRPYLASNPRIVAQIYDLALAGNDYVLKRPYPNRMLQTLNIKAAAVSLGTLSDATLKATVEAAKPPKGPRDTA